MSYGKSILDEEVLITKRDLTLLHVSTYVNGFNELDTTINIIGKTIMIGIYYPSSNEKLQKLANKLKISFEKQIPHKIQKFTWAEELDLVSSVYKEN